jgi:hypothetical protein
VSSCGSAGTTCTVCPSNAACASYSCNGTSCVTNYVQANTQCVAADPEDCRGASYCTGSSASCPQPSGCAVGSCCQDRKCVSPCP